MLPDSTASIVAPLFFLLLPFSMLWWETEGRIDGGEMEGIDLASSHSGHYIDIQVEIFQIRNFERQLSQVPIIEKYTLSP